MTKTSPTTSREMVAAVALVVAASHVVLPRAGVETPAASPDELAAPARTEALVPAVHSGFVVVGEDGSDTGDDGGGDDGGDDEGDD